MKQLEIFDDKIWETLGAAQLESFGLFRHFRKMQFDKCRKFSQLNLRLAQ